MFMLKLYNTLTRKREVFKSIKKNQVGMYVCGPTVYDYAHIGNFRAYISADLLRRYLEYKGYKVKQIMNLTDVDDKTIKRSRIQKISLKKFTEKYIKAFFEDAKKLNIKKASKYPKATNHIKDMVNLIKILLKKKYAYKTKDGIYFSVSKFKNYGKLARLKIKDLKIGARIKKDEYEKEQANDFALWKFWDKHDGNVFWNTEIGKGRPGWHIECSTMSTKYLGQPFDIHAGGVDLVFPHHENEIAQSEAAKGKKFVNYWFHNGWLLVEGNKMSKSLGNFYTLRDFLKKNYDAKAIRYVLLATHYRQQLNLTFKELDAAKNSIKRLQEFISNLKKDNPKTLKLINNTKKDFENAMDDDLNISKALAIIFNFVKEVNKVGGGKKALKLIKKFDKVLGLNLKVEKIKIPKIILTLIKKRELARNKKDWKKADKIRNEIKKKGYFIEDSKSGSIIKKGFGAFL